MLYALHAHSACVCLSVYPYVCPSVCPYVRLPRAPLGRLNKVRRCNKVRSVFFLYFVIVNVDKHVGKWKNEPHTHTHTHTQQAEPRNIIKTTAATIFCFCFVFLFFFGFFLYLFTKIVRLKRQKRRQWAVLRPGAGEGLRSRMSKKDQEKNKAESVNETK